jgi:parallel beta-helix repeat protein
MPTNGVHNISADPQLASAWYLSAESPCIGAGSATYASGTDIDGDPWNNPPSIGCDEYHAGAVRGPLTVAISADYTNVATSFPLGLTAFIEGRTDLSVWEFGDGFVEVNEPYTSHAWTAPGDYLMALWAFNDSYPGGVSATVTVHVEEGLHYVAASSGNPVAPYTSWATAATNIQDAVDAAVAGGTVFVTNGTYAAGVVVDKPLTLQSVNGPDFTVINGGGTNECVYLTNNAMMVGFTLTNGVGGAYCESSAVLSNCVLTAQGWRGALGGTLNNCTLTGNSGGGAAGCALNNCTLTGNSAEFGGGAYSSTLNNCTLTANLAQLGGGAHYSTLNNCTLTGNSAQFGGGACSSTLNNCIVYFNSDTNGGNYDPLSTLNYCCTTPLPTNGVGNISADPQLASASHLSAGSPCIGAGSAIYASGMDIDGDAWANPPSIGCDEYHAGAVTGPLTVSLTATFTNVSIGFPLGLRAFIEGCTDLSVWDFGDGFVQANEPYTSHPWTAPGDYLVALWAFNDSYPGGVNATLTIHVEEGLHYVANASGNPVAPYTSWATAAKNIQDAVDVAGAGGTIFVTNGTYGAGGRTTPATGDGATNRVAVDKPLTVRSVNGPGVTVIKGQTPGATRAYLRCVYLTNAATLVGFTLTNGGSGNGSGGGVYCESTSAVLSNCVLRGNSNSLAGGGAYGGTLNNCTLSGNSAGAYGGGADNCTLNNCTLTGNSVGLYGGGADNCTLNNCTLTGNSAVYGGGAYGGTLNNCIVYFNSAPYGGNYMNGFAPQYPPNYCCTTPLLPAWNGVGNITNAPLFVNYAGGNLRLQSNSPCINSGNNAYVVGSTDLDGNPRIVGGTVDIGAYEYQTPVSMISYAWLQQYGLPINTNTDTADLDGTGMNLYQDWIAGLNPTNALSVLQMTSATATNNPAGLVVTWQSVDGIMYFLQTSTNLAAQRAFSTIQSNIVGQAGTTSYTDTTATNAGPYFYRVGVGN